jgi:hypothetical protein
MNSTKYIIFGWTIHKNALADGEGMATVFNVDTPVESCANWTFWTTGERIATVYPSDLDDPFFIQQRGRFENKVEFAGHVYKQGNYVFKAVGDAEFWCFDSTLNGNVAPDFEFVLLAANQSYTTSVGQLILISSGDTNLGAIPTALEIVSEGLVITANIESSLIIFSRTK